jgi:hypothetical protein
MRRDHMEELHRWKENIKNEPWRNSMKMETGFTWAGLGQKGELFAMKMTNL